jgi:hypothetical protein
MGNVLRIIPTVTDEDRRIRARQRWRTMRRIDAHCVTQWRRNDDGKCARAANAARRREDAKTREDACTDREFVGSSTLARCGSSRRKARPFVHSSRCGHATRARIGISIRQWIQIAKRDLESALRLLRSASHAAAGSDGAALTTAGCSVAECRSSRARRRDSVSQDPLDEIESTPISAFLEGREHGHQHP